MNYKLPPGNNLREGCFTQPSLIGFYQLILNDAVLLYIIGIGGTCGQ